MNETQKATITQTGLLKYRREIDVHSLSIQELAAMLSPKQQLFCANYLKYNDAGQAAIEAGYSKKNAKTSGRALITKNKFIKEYITRKQLELQSSSIADAQEILQYLTDVMRGEVKDQFGLDAPLSERTRAATELARRQIDMADRNADRTTEVKIRLVREDKPADAKTE